MVSTPFQITSEAVTQPESTSRLANSFETLVTRAARREAHRLASVLWRFPYR